MKKILTLSILLMITTVANASVLGKGYIGANVGIVKPGDEIVKEVDDSIMSYSINLELPVSSNIDLSFSLDRSILEGEIPWRRDDYEEESTSISAAIIYQFMPEKVVNPFFGIGGVLLKTDVRINGSDIGDIDDEDAFLVIGGLEYNINDNLSILSVLTYNSDIFDEDDITAEVSLNSWVTSAFLVSADLGYAFEDENISLSLGVAYGF